MKAGHWPASLSCIRAANQFIFQGLATHNRNRKIFFSALSKSLSAHLVHSPSVGWQPLAKCINKPVEMPAARVNCGHKESRVDLHGSVDSGDMSVSVDNGSVQGDLLG